MFPKDLSVDALNHISTQTMVDHLGITITEVGDDYLVATMPVDRRTIQPMGLLHGGASVALAETLGSIASAILLSGKNQAPVGLEINSNHIRAVREGIVKGKVTPIHIGKRTHVWDIRITNQENQLVNVSRLTVAVIDKKNDS